jgi:hypothetical protein
MSRCVLAHLIATTRRDEKYSEEEAQRRFLAAVKAGLSTEPKPLKSLSRKRSKKQSKKARHVQKR